MKKEKFNLLLLGESDLSASLFVSIVAIILGLAYYLARFGFEDNSFLKIILVIGLSLFLIFFPEVLDLLRSERKEPKRWYNSKSFGLILGLLLLVVLGIIAPIVNLLYLFSTLGLILFIFFLYIYFRYVKKRRFFLVIFVLALALSAWAIGALWGRSLLNPLYLERIVLGKAPIDAIFHSSVVSMIKTYWVPSTGLDGVPYLQYHWGSHYIFAQISKLLNASSIDFYNFAYPILFVPFVIRSFIYLIGNLQGFFRINPYRGWRLYLLLVLAFTGVIPENLLKKMGILIFDIFVSESYSLALAISFILLSLIFKLKNRLILKKVPPDIAIFLTVFVPLALGLIGLLKISMFILLGIAFSYLLIRLGLYRKLHFRISAILCLAVAIAVFRYSYLGGESNFHLFHYLGQWVDEDFRSFFPLIYFFWLWVYIAIRLKILGVKTFSDIRKLLKKKKILDLEFLLVIAFAGVVPGMVFDIPGGSAFFFSDFQRWLSLAFILALIPLWWPKLIYKKNLGISGLKLSTICFVLAIVFASYYSYRNIENVFLLGFVRKNIKIRYQLTSKESEIRKMGHGAYIKYLITKKHLPVKEAVVATASQAQKDLKNNKKYQLIMFLKNQLYLSGKEDAAIFVPQENYFYWNLADYRNIQFIAPSLTGMPMLGGVQPFVKKELNEEEMEAVTESFDNKKMQTFKNFYSKTKSGLIDPLSKEPVVEYTLKKDLTYDEKVTIYDLVAPEYFRSLLYYGYWLYDFPSEEEYLKRYSSDEGICLQATKKNFSQVVVITSDQNSNLQSRELNCR